MNVMYWICFELLQILSEVIKTYPGVLTRFTGHTAEVYGYLDIDATFEGQERQRIKSTRYLVMDAPSAYNLILGRPALNDLVASLSYPQLCIKFPLLDGRTMTIKGDQTIARKCYTESTRIQIVRSSAAQPQDVGLLDLNRRLYDPAREEKRPKPADDLKEVVIRPLTHQKTKIGASLLPTTERQLVKFLSDNLDVFAWSPQDMPSIDPNFICHRLSLSPTVNPVAQRKRKQGEEKSLVVREET